MVSQNLILFFILLKKEGKKYKAFSIMYVGPFLSQ